MACVRVGLAVEFDDEFGLCAVEINGVGADGLLAFEFQIGETVCAEVGPHDALCFGLV